MNENVVFGRLMLKEVVKDVKAILPDVRPMKDGWVYHHDGDHWEFQITVEKHGLKKHYWHGNADSAYMARANGWSDYLEKHHGEALRALEKERGDAT